MLPQRTVVSVVFISATFLSVMDITIVNVALPSIGRDFGTTPTEVSAVSIAYLVALSVVIPVAGWLGDRFGYRRILLSAIVMFTTGSLLGGLSQSFGQLIAFQVLKGIGGGMMSPAGTALLFRTFVPSERVRVARILLLPSAIGAATGPAIGGILVTELSWRWVFFVNVPIGIAAVVFGYLFLAEQQTEPAGKLSVTAVVLSVLGFAGVVFSLSVGPRYGWLNPVILSTLVTGSVLVAVLVVHQLRAAEPMLRFRLFVNRLFRFGNIVVFLYTGATQGTLLVVTLMVQDGLGLSPLVSGLTTLPQALGVIIGSQLVSRFLYARFGPRRLMAAGLVGAAASAASIAFVDSASQLLVLPMLMLAFGYCVSHVMVSSQVATLAQISRGDTGRASSLLISSRQLGGALGVAVCSMTMAAVGVSDSPVVSPPDLAAFHAAAVVAGLIALLGVVAALRINDDDAADTRPN